MNNFPEVASVEVRSVQNPTNRIIHVLNRHYVSREDYAVVAPTQSYEAFVDDVEAVQLEQMKFLKRLKDRTVRYEGVTEKKQLPINFGRKGDSTEPLSFRVLAATSRTFRFWQTFASSRSDSANALVRERPPSATVHERLWLYGCGNAHCRREF